MPPVRPEEPDDPPAALLLFVLLADPPAPPAPPGPEPAELVFELPTVELDRPPFVAEWALESSPGTGGLQLIECPGLIGGCMVVGDTVAFAVDCAMSQQPAAPATTTAARIFQLDMMNRNSALVC